MREIRCIGLYRQGDICRATVFFVGKREPYRCYDDIDKLPPEAWEFMDSDDVEMKESKTGNEIANVYRRKVTND